MNCTYPWDLSAAMFLGSAAAGGAVVCIVILLYLSWRTPTGYKR